ncbi:MAG: hypothetical protein CBC09_04010 [Cellvibrionales bacterium TMED49]|nr:hypothetical protein [Porticoccaceae bacterium]OUU38983.1 MAG: hypothetical protein CBC09_04010 [Cellvibrionales bacterium TMED49]
MIYKRSFVKFKSILFSRKESSQRSALFDHDFLWGAASAAQHVEHQQESDWTIFERQVINDGKTSTDARPGYALPGHINSLDKFSQTVRLKKTNFDYVFDKDFALASELGHNSHRFSICWARLFPTRDLSTPVPEAIRFYHKILDSLEKYNIKPFVTLFHFSTPNWFWDEIDGKRGWERKDAIRHFERFIHSVLDAFGDRISLWTTLNEPMTYVYNGYMQGIFPPLEKRDINGVVTVIEQLLKAHAAAYKLIHDHAIRKNLSVKVGIAKHTRAFHALRNWAPFDIFSSKAVGQAFIWDFMDAINSGVLNISNTAVKKHIPGLAGTQDYIGINYYGRFYIKSNLLNISKPEIHFYNPKKLDEKRSDLDWAIYPRGLYEILLATHKRYKIPIYVLENGLADCNTDDLRRQSFIVNHIDQMWLAKNDGVDIRGYMHWSLTDNFEWAEGFTARFGLIGIEYENNFKRIPRPSATLYHRIIKDRGITSQTRDRVKQI